MNLHKNARTCPKNTTVRGPRTGPSRSGDSFCSSGHRDPPVRYSLKSLSKDNGGAGEESLEKLYNVQ